MTLLLQTLDVIAGLNPEDEQQPEKRIEVERTPELEEILALYDTFIERLIENLGFVHIYSHLFTSQSLLQNLVTLPYSAQIITQASIALSSKNSFHLGQFLTALVQRSGEQSHIIYALEPLQHVGIRLDGKDLRIVGNVGNHAAYSMISGNLIVEGNAGSHAAYMMSGGMLHVRGNVQDFAFNMGSGGEVVVDGSAGNYAGRFLMGGSLLIKKNCGDFLGSYLAGKATITVLGATGEQVGLEMNGGVIKLYGTHSLSPPSGGYIYHKDSLIVPKGSGA